MNWLFKEEPAHYSYDELARDKKTVWSGVKNPLAQKHLHAVKKGDRIEVLLVGTLSAGRVFVNRQDRDRPLRVKLAEGLEPRGLLAGIPGMKVGGKRKLYLPAELGYGDKGKGQIPANAKLIYEVEVLRIVPPGEAEPRPFDD